jgi:hypothetical protein
MNLGGGYGGRSACFIVPVAINHLEFPRIGVQGTKVRTGFCLLATVSIQALRLGELQRRPGNNRKKITLCS